ncbi:hypothetical protein MRB53_022765 [Persea americana]|uniref:Uncharacterized protein n=1 Tax=Persea americana TaxID=3435 RepID=A0ACC2L7I7_PERAE|nr:hypothetical protein MRB53_022765 [Persea americana]
MAGAMESDMGEPSLEDGEWASGALEESIPVAGLGWATGSDATDGAIIRSESAFLLHLRLHLQIPCFSVSVPLSLTHSLHSQEEEQERTRVAYFLGLVL